MVQLCLNVDKYFVIIIFNYVLKKKLYSGPCVLEFMHSWDVYKLYSVILCRQNKLLGILVNHIIVIKCLLSRKSHILLSLLSSMKSLAKLITTPTWCKMKFYYHTNYYNFCYCYNYLTYQTVIDYLSLLYRLITFSLSLKVFHVDNCYFFSTTQSFSRRQMWHKCHFMRS